MEYETYDEIRGTEAEQGLIAAILDDLSKAFDLIQKVPEEMLVDSRHKAIRAALKDIVVSGDAISYPVLVLALKERGHNLEAYMKDLIAHGAGAHSFNRFLRAVNNEYIKRAAKTININSYSAIDTGNAVETTSRQIAELQKLIPPIECRADSALTTKRLIDDIKEIQSDSNNQGIIGVPTGIEAFDKETGGFRKYSLVTLAAHSGSYKTYFALNIATNYAKMGKSVLYFSLEMSDRELLHRILPMIKPPMNKIVTRDLYQTDLESYDFQKAIEEYQKLKFCIDWGTRDPHQMLLYAQQLRHSPNGLDLVVVDHLQLLKDSADPRILSEYTGMFKSFALSYNVPVIVLSQFNRKNMLGQKPNRSWLKGSSSIETDSDAIMFLHRETQEQPTVELILDKFRQSASSSCVTYDLAFDSFTNKLIHSTAPKLFKKPKSKGTENEAGF